MGKQLQLFILPFAGGSADSFKELVELLDDRVEAITIEYSGRGNRRREPFATSFNNLIDDAVQYATLQRKKEMPYSILGYSMGGIIAYEFLARKYIRGENVHNFICAEISPKDRARELSQVYSVEDDYLLARAMELGGVDRKILEDERFRNIYIRPMISDFRLLHEYRFCPKEKRVMADITFFYSEKDTPKELLSGGWTSLVDGKLDYYEFGDNHFFLKQYYSEMANIINEHLLKYLK